jgi:hypothetical protein
VSAPGDYDNGEIGGMIGRGNRSTRRKPSPVPLCPPQTPHAARTRTRAAALGSQRLTAELRHGHADHLLSSFAGVKYTWSYTSSPPYVMAWCLIKHFIFGRFTVRISTEKPIILRFFVTFLSPLKQMPDLGYDFSVYLILPAALWP